MNGYSQSHCKFCLTLSKIPSHNKKPLECNLHHVSRAIELHAEPSSLKTRMLHHASRNSCVSCSRLTTRALSIALAGSATDGPNLADIELAPILNLQGLVQPTVPDGTEASIFAIFDENKKLQYVGFSKDCRNSLRTVFTRRPQKAHYYKATHLPKLDQQQMLNIRESWYEEVGGAPNGNRLAIERNQWQLPISSGAISDRGKKQSAEKEVEMLREIFASRGCKEELVPDPELLADGKVDFLTSRALSPEELKMQKEALASRNRAVRNVVTSVDGNQADFQIFIEASYKTKGGYIFDVKVTFEERETPHRVIIGREYYEDLELQPEQVLDRSIAYLLGKKVQRQTEGLMMNGEFPINYFSISTIEQYFDDFATAFQDTGKQLRGEDKFWRFNRVHTYGDQAREPAHQLPASS